MNTVADTGETGYNRDTAKALAALRFERSYVVDGKTKWQCAVFTCSLIEQLGRTLRRKRGGHCDEFM